MPLVGKGWSEMGIGLPFRPIWYAAISPVSSPPDVYRNLPFGTMVTSTGNLPTRTGEPGTCRSDPSTATAKPVTAPSPTPWPPTPRLAV